MSRWASLADKIAQQTQQLVNHHVHPLDRATGERRLLPGCIAKDRPNECKSAYPRTGEAELFSDSNAILCPGLCKTLGVKSTGKRSKLGSTAGKRNHPMLNGGLKAMLRDMRCNSDTIFTLRLPICAKTHTHCTDPECTSEDTIRKLVTAVRRANRDQAGYISDYVSKKFPVAKRETHALETSFNTLEQQIRNENDPTLKRYVTDNTIDRSIDQSIDRWIDRSVVIPCSPLADGPNTVGNAR